MNDGELQAMRESISYAEGVIAEAETVRKYWRRRYTPRGRRELWSVRKKCAEAAKPIRSYLGMVAWHEDFPLEIDLKLRRVSKALRYERRQIDKMQLRR